MIAMLIAAASATTVSVSPTIQIDEGDVHAVYHVELRNDGTRRYVGTYDGTIPFSFTARPNGRVDGIVGNEAVSFFAGNGRR